MSNAMIWTKEDDVIHFGKEAQSIGREKARKEGKNWIYWRNSQNVGFSARLTPHTLKKAMLTCGTQGTFTLYSRNAYAEMVNWSLAALWLKKLRNGTWVH